MVDEKLARAIRSRIRRNILEWLSEKERVSVHEFAEHYELSESCASKHFKLLYDLGFLDSEEKHPEKFYFLKVKELKQLVEVYRKVVKRIEES